jgi:hypothetical protein
VTINDTAPAGDRYSLFIIEFARRALGHDAADGCDDGAGDWRDSLRHERHGVRRGDR